MAAAVVALGMAVALLAVLVVGLLRAHAEVLRSLHDLGVTTDGADRRLRRSGTVTRDDLPPFDPEAETWRPEEAGLGPAHDLTGSLPDGGAAHVAVTGVDHDTILAFLSTGCATCAEFWDALAAPGAAGRAGERTRVVIITKGHEEESEAAVAELAPAEVTTIMSTAAWSDYRIPASPFFLRVHGPAGQVTGEGSGQSWDQVLRLLERSESDSRAAARRTRRELLTGGAGRAAVADRITSSVGEGAEEAG
jgi:hypothetical protein